jgi:FG-GAP repeat
MSSVLKILGWSVVAFGGLVASIIFYLVLISIPEKVVVWERKAVLPLPEFELFEGLVAPMPTKDDIDARSSLPQELPSTENDIYISENSKHSLLGSNRVAVSGETLIVSPSPKEIIVFAKQGSSWIQQTRLVIPDAHNFDQTVSLSISQNTVIAVNRKFSGRSERNVYLFERNPNTLSWSKAIQIDPPKGTTGFGSSAAIHHNVMVISSYSEIDKNGRVLRRGESQKAAYMETSYRDSVVVYEKNLETRDWIHKAILADPDGDNMSNFGYSISVEGDKLVVGAPFAQRTYAIHTGAVHVFQHQPQTGQWLHQARIVPQGANLGNFLEQFIYYQFGVDVLVRNNRILVGSCSGEINGGTIFFTSPETAAYLYQQDSATKRWQQQGKIQGVGCGTMNMVDDQALILDPATPNPDGSIGSMWTYGSKNHLP